MKPEEDISVEMPETIEVPKAWLQELATLSEQATIEVEKTYEGDAELLPLGVSKLIGFASSAKNLIN